MEKNISIIFFSCISQQTFFEKTEFLLRAELLRAISDYGFEHPSEGKRFAFSVTSSRVALV